ncbi:MAG TPA: hypothetical protein VF665_19375 [Longimicrobium sp.]|jgi:hypothetical protein|uniref:hypothetical protein n=1 Tax=Longimicrobium sp. TaxID=2029185 RepID=UPI002ED96762
MKTFRVLLGATLIAALGACSNGPTEPAAAAGTRGARAVVPMAADTTAIPPASTSVATDPAPTTPVLRDNGLIGSGGG